MMIQALSLLRSTLLAAAFVAYLLFAAAVVVAQVKPSPQQQGGKAGEQAAPARLIINGQPVTAATDSTGQIGRILVQPQAPPASNTPAAENSAQATPVQAPPAPPVGNPQAGLPPTPDDVPPNQPLTPDAQVNQGWIAVDNSPASAPYSEPPPVAITAVDLALGIAGNISLPATTASNSDVVPAAPVSQSHLDSLDTAEQHPSSKVVPASHEANDSSSSSGADAQPIAAGAQALNETTKPSPQSVAPSAPTTPSAPAELLDRMTSPHRIERSLDAIRNAEIPEPDVTISRMPAHQPAENSPPARQKIVAANAHYYPSTDSAPVAQAAADSSMNPPGSVENVSANAVRSAPESAPGFNARGQRSMLQPLHQPSLFADRNAPQDPNCPPVHVQGTPAGELHTHENLMRQQLQRQRDLATGEYLHDGGDRKLPVVVDSDWNVKGLDPEDTVGHFDTIDGRRVVVPSNRVDIYAPRFAAVTKIGNLNNANSFERINLVADTQQSFQSGGLDQATTTKQHVAPERNVKSRVANELRDQTRGLTVDNTTQTAMASGKFGPEKIHQFLVTGTLQDSEKAFLGIAVKSAVTWSSDLEVKVANQGVALVVIDDVEALREITETHAPNADNRLRVVKMASTDGAQPGDEIDFMIRFDNVGNQTIGNVTVMDNLTTRLEFIPGSASCSVQADLITTPNKAQSSLLRWEIIDPLEPGQGGLIKFRCKVR